MKTQHDSTTPVIHKDDDASLELLIRQCQQRGNRLEVMNGKIYEVSRKLIGEIK